MEKESSEIIVKFSDVTKQYGDLVVLDKLNLEINNYGSTWKISQKAWNFG